MPDKKVYQEVWPPKMIKFSSAFGVWSRMTAWGQGDVKNEPMLFACDWSYAWAQGGPITRDFLAKLPGSYDYVIDSRVHMLMPGWYPCIPGWHLDDVPRTRADGQPDHANPEYKAQHVFAMVGDASLTEFAVGDCELEDVPLGSGVVYGKWHHEIERLIEEGKLAKHVATELDFHWFNWQTFHRGMPATKNGWRFFIRASWQTKRPVFNEVRRQTQIYMPAVDAGW